MASRNKQNGYLKMPSNAEWCFLLFMIIMIGGSIPYVVVPWIWSLLKPWLHSITG